jgi:hypothetical protein
MDPAIDSLQKLKTDRAYTISRLASELNPLYETTGTPLIARKHFPLTPNADTIAGIEEEINERQREIDALAAKAEQEKRLAKSHRLFQYNSGSPDTASRPSDDVKGKSEDDSRTSRSHGAVSPQIPRPMRTHIGTASRLHCPDTGEFELTKRVAIAHLHYLGGMIWYRSRYLPSVLLYPETRLS